MTQTSFAIHNGLYQRIKAMAHAEGTSIQRLVIALLTEAVDRRDTEQREAPEPRTTQGP